MQHIKKHLPSSAHSAFRAALTLCLTFGTLFAKAEKSTSPQLPKRQFFIENKGQWHADVLYLVRTGGLDAWITKTGVTYDFYAVEKKQSTRMMMPHESETEESRRYGQVVRVANLNANINPAPVGKDKSSAYYNYFIGNDQNQWASNVGLYAEATVQNIYNGIAQRWYFENNNLRYDYIVQPNADYKQIQLSIEGANNMRVKGNDLIFTTRFGEVKQAELLVYQNINGKKQSVNAQWQIQNGKASFVLGDYNSSLPLVIDPLIYSTFIGNVGNEIGDNIAVDGSGNAYITGTVYSSVYPTTVGAYDQSHNGGNDVFVTKLNPAGTALIHSTFIGGSNGEAGHSIAVDNNGNTYITGYTDSGNFPVTAGAYDLSFNGGTSDVFVTKLNSTGTALIYSTYIGDSSHDVGHAIKLDGNDNAYITGSSQSISFPTTAGAYDQSHNGNNDVFVTKLNSTGTALIYSTFIGGSSTEEAFSIAIDNNGDAYITGYTGSGNFPVTVGAYNQTQGGSNDVFVTKLNSAGNGLLYSTFIGGNGSDVAHSIAVDSNGNAYITGDTDYSTAYPTTTGAYNVTYNGGGDAFVTKLNPAGNGLVYSTFIGGGSSDFSNGIAIDGFGNAYIIGYTYSQSFPITAGAINVTHNSGTYDVFVSKLSSAGSSLLYSTFLGGSGHDIARGITIDGNNHAYITGYTESTAYPTTNGAYDVTHNGGTYDVFVTKIGLCVATSATISPVACGSYTSPSGSHVYTSTGIYQDTLINSTGCDSLLTIYLTLNSLPSFSVNSGTICFGPTGFTIMPVGNAISYTYSGGSAFVNPPVSTAYTVTGASAQGCTNIAISHLTVNSSLTVVITGGGSICINQTATLTASGATTYTWSTNENSANIIVSPSVNTAYSVHGTDNNGCRSYPPNGGNVIVSVEPCTGIDELGMQNNELKIYPNPVSSMLNVELEIRNAELEISIIDVLGKEMMNEKLKIETGAVQINVSELPKGIYFLKIETNNYPSVRRKFVKE